MITMSFSDLSEAARFWRLFLYGGVTLVAVMLIACVSCIWLASSALDRARLAEERAATCVTVEHELIDARASVRTVRELMGVVEQRAGIKKAVGIGGAP